MTDLLTRLEALDGPSREVDAEIWKLVAPEDFERAYWDARALADRRQPKSWQDQYATGRAMQRSPRYTGSTDAALTLESEKRHWRLLLALAMNRTAQREGPLEKWMLAVDCCITAIEAHHD